MTAPRPGLVAVALLTLALALATVGTAWGLAAVPPTHVARVLGSLVGLVDPTAVPAGERFLILHVRLPQVVLLGLVGSALACSGAALQAAFENPLADPGLLGVTGGASLGAVLAVVSGLAGGVFLALPTLAFGGGLAASLLVYALAHLGGRPTPATLLLTGVAVGSTAAALVTAISLAAGYYKAQVLVAWLVGGVRDETWDHVGLASLPVIVGVGGLVALHRRIDALLLGDEAALAVGVPVVGTRLTILVLTALATGAATAVGGTISFVGLMVPHLIRRATGPRTADLLPACVGGGAAFLIACELASKAMSGRVALPLGILTAILGGPTFLALLVRSRREVG